MCFSSLSSQGLRADIIDDINELDMPKKKSKNSEETTSENSEATESDSGVKTGDTPPLSPKAPQGKTPSVVDKVPVPVKAESSSNKASETGPSNTKSNPAGTKAEREARKKIPVYLSSEGTSTYSQNGSFVNLQKNVVITQDDIKIQANEANLRMSKQSGGVSEAEMMGKVSLVRSSKDPAERISAQGDRALFENEQQLVTLEGNARLLRDGHLVKGDRIIYEIVTGMVKVDRVQGVVRPERAEK